MQATHDLKKKQQSLEKIIDSINRMKYTTFSNQTQFNVRAVNSYFYTIGFNQASISFNQCQTSVIDRSLSE